MLTLGGYLLGHAHRGRQFHTSAHGAFAKLLLVPLAAQFALGVYLKLHIHEQTLRPWAVRAHGVVGKSYPVLGWTQMLFGAIVFGGYCRDDALPQCLAHYIMVRASIRQWCGKGVVLTRARVCDLGRWIYRVCCHLGNLAPRGGCLGSQKWAQPRLVGFMGHLSVGACVPHLASTMRCELIASFSDRESVCFVSFSSPWFCPDLLRFRSLFISDRSVNTFTEHRGSVWSVKDMQHTYVSETLASDHLNESP